MDGSIKSDVGKYDTDEDKIISPPVKIQLFFKYFHISYYVVLISFSLGRIKTGLFYFILFYKVNIISRPLQNYLFRLAIEKTLLLNDFILFYFIL